MCSYSLTDFNKTARNILELLCQGKSQTEIQECLQIQDSTYRYHLNKFRRYFEKDEPHQFVYLCHKHGFFPHLSPNREIITEI